MKKWSYIFFLSVAVKLGPQDLPHLSNRHNYSDSCEQHGQMDDYRSGVYENLVNHFTTNPVTNMDKVSSFKFM